MFHQFPQDEDDAMTATMIESHNFQRRTRINYLMRFMLAVSRDLRGGGGVASTIISLAQM